MSNLRLADAIEDVKRLASRGAKPKQIATLTGVGVEALYDRWASLSDRKAARGPTRPGTIVLERDPLHAGVFLCIVDRIRDHAPAVGPIDLAILSFDIYEAVILPRRRAAGRPAYTIVETIELIRCYRAGAIFRHTCQCWQLPIYLTKDMAAANRRCPFARDLPPPCKSCSPPKAKTAPVA